MGLWDFSIFSPCVVRVLREFRFEWNFLCVGPILENFEFEYSSPFVGSVMNFPVCCAHVLETSSLNEFPCVLALEL